MFIVNKRFLKPTKETRLVAILESLRINPEFSQAELGKRALISSARVNSFLRDLQSKQIIEIKPINGKNLRYELTPKGEELRRVLLGEYMAEIVQIYNALKENIENKLIEIKNMGYKRLAFFGAASTCEIVLSCINSLGLNIVTIVDNDKTKQGSLLFGHIIAPPIILKFIDIDAVLITSFAKHEEIRKNILELIPEKKLKIFNL